MTSTDNNQSSVRLRALDFLKQVGELLPENYEHLLSALSDFRSKRITCREVQKIAIKLLRNEKELAAAFVQFLPASERDSYEQQVAALPDTSQKKRKRDTDYNEGRVSGLHQYQQQLKNSLPITFNQKAVWKDVNARVKTMVEQIKAQGSNWIPVITYDDIANNRVPQAVIDHIKVAGVVKIQKTIPKDTVDAWNNQVMKELKMYLDLDPTSVESYNRFYTFPESKAPRFGGVQQIFYSKAQFEAREHPNLVNTRVWLNKNLWKYMDGEEYVFVPDQETTYIDRLRHRIPKYETQTGMKDHVDNGSLCHWADVAWQRVYANIWKGELDQYDPWDAQHRTETAGVYFRSLQGWLALTSQGPDEGTLEVVPMVKEAMLYILLRPLQGDVPYHQFPGARDAGLGDSIEITSRWHAPLLQAKMSIGAVDAGDTVWWHPDLIHSVEPEHNGDHPSNVFYIAAAPLCPMNAQYLVSQKKAFLNGQVPPDFVHAACIEDNQDLRTKLEDLSDLGKQMMGFSSFKTEMGSAADRIVQQCNRICQDST